MKLLLSTFLFSIASALLPVLNLEAYLAVVAAEASNLPALELAVLAGAGQMVGKAVWFYAGRRSLDLSWLRKKMAQPKWAASYVRWHARIHGRPVMAGLITLVSAASGFPPFAVIAVLAGSLRMNLVVFLVTGFVGRTLRFWAVLAGVSLVIGH